MSNTTEQTLRGELSRATTELTGLEEELTLIPLLSGSFTLASVARNYWKSRDGERS